MNNKVHHAFALFFVIFFAVCSFPVLIGVFQNTRNYMIRAYDRWMQNRNIEVFQPTKEIRSPYGDALPKKSPVVQPQRKGWADSRFTLVRRWKTFDELMLPERKYVEQWVVELFPFRDEFSTFNMAFKYNLGMKMPIENETVVSLPNKKIAHTLSEAKSSISKTEKDSILKYKELCNKNNTKFFMVFRPVEQGIHHDRSEPYKGLELDYYQKEEQRASEFEDLGIKTFLLYKAMRKEIPEEKWVNYWYMTDHHWNVDGALIAGKLIADYLNRNCGTSYDPDYFAPETYIRKRWKNVFIGSLGKKFTLSYSNDQREDFDILYPRFTTGFTIEIPEKSYIKRGDFSVLLSPERIHYNSYWANPYSAFLGGDNKIVRIVNHKIPKGKKIIVIKDSYSNAMIPYLALQTKEIVLLDPRFISQKEIETAIKREKADILFIMYAEGI